MENTHFKNVLAQCKVDDIVLVNTMYATFTARVKDKSITANWIEVAFTDAETLILSEMDIEDIMLFSASRMESERNYREKCLEMLSCKYKISLWDSIQKARKKDYLILGKFAEIWTSLLDHEKKQLLKIFELDKEGMDFLLTKLCNQSQIIASQRGSIDALTNKVVQDGQSTSKLNEIKKILGADAK